MNVRDFLFNFVSANTKICLRDCRTLKILYYGRADGLEYTNDLNRLVEHVSYFVGDVCLTLLVRDASSGLTYHLPEDLDYVY